MYAPVMFVLIVCHATVVCERGAFVFDCVPVPAVDECACDYLKNYRVGQCQVHFVAAIKCCSLIGCHHRQRSNVLVMMLGMT